MVKMSYTEEYKVLSTLLDEVMSEESKNRLCSLKIKQSDRDKDLINTAFKAGWMRGVNDCGDITLRGYIEWKEYHEYMDNEA